MTRCLGLQMLHPVIKSLPLKKPVLQNCKLCTALSSAPLTYPALIAICVFGEPWQTYRCAVMESKGVEFCIQVVILGTKRTSFTRYNPSPHRHRHQHKHQCFFLLQLQVRSRDPKVKSKLNGYFHTMIIANTMACLVR